MGRKTIWVREDVYEIREAQKRPDECFSELLERLTHRSDQFEQASVHWRTSIWTRESMDPTTDWT